MPTGYTAKLCDGEQGFEEFALECARAFGATITMRDEPSDKEIPEFEPNTHSAEALKIAIKRKSEILSMTDDQCHEMAIAGYEKERDNCEKYRQDCEEKKQRLEAMMVQVESWESPSPDHKEYREFMLDQLRKTIDFDADPKYYKERLSELKIQSGNEWQKKALEKIDWNIDYHTKENNREITRVNGRNKWVRQLRESLADKE
jgi:hypothetical protein